MAASNATPAESGASLFMRLRRSALSVKLAALGALVTAIVVLLAFLALSVEIRTRLRRVDGDLLLVTDDSGRVFAAAGSNGITVPRGTNLTTLGAVARAL